MIVGDPVRFAIEAKVEEQVEGWVFGHIRFWACGHSIGDWRDTTDLLGCLRWLKDFCEQPRNRYEPALVPLPPSEAFHRVWSPVMAGGTPTSEECIPDAYSRFHVSHLGMSSFDRFDVLLLTDAVGAERILWREGGSDEVLECRLDPGEMERTAGDFCRELDKELSSGPAHK